MRDKTIAWIMVPFFKKKYLSLYYFIKHCVLERFKIMNNWLKIILACNTTLICLIIMIINPYIIIRPGGLEDKLTLLLKVIYIFITFFKLYLLLKFTYSNIFLPCQHCLYYYWKHLLYRRVSWNRLIKT